jgi:hypothetical protein
MSGEVIPSDPVVTPEAITPGTAILATATIDSLFTALFANRSAAVNGTATYIWATDNVVQGYYPDGSMVQARFEARAFAPNFILRQ